jgi:hypothetical protein
MDPKTAKQPQAPKKIKITSINCHIAVPVEKDGKPIGVSNSLGKTDHKFDMELHPAGVLMRYPDQKTGQLIPYANVQYIKVEFEE